MMRAVLLLGLVLAACAAPPPGLPPGARPDLGTEWVDGSGYRWPPRDGFEGQVVYMVLPPGVLLDRFGQESGRFFSPKGAGFRARALPTVCRELPYRAYRVIAPLPVRIGSAVAWFGEPGGAMQVMTDATAAQLVAYGVLEHVPGAVAPCG